MCGHLGHGRWSSQPWLHTAGTAQYHLWVLLQFQNGLMVGEEISVLECLVCWLLRISRLACGPWPSHLCLSPLSLAQVDPHPFISFSQMNNPCSGKGPSLHYLTLPREVGVVLAPAPSLDPGPNEAAHFCFSRWWLWDFVCFLLLFLFGLGFSFLRFFLI